MFISQTAHMITWCRGLKKKKVDALVIKKIIQAAAPSAIVHDQSNE